MTNMPPINKLILGDNLEILKQLQLLSKVKIQILTDEDLINHKTVNIPRSLKTTFKTAQREAIKNNNQKKLFEPEN